MLRGEFNMSALPKDLVEKCKGKLINAKADLLNRVRESRQDLHNADDNKGGDEGDQNPARLG